MYSHLHIHFVSLIKLLISRAVLTVNLLFITIMERSYLWIDVAQIN